MLFQFILSPDSPFTQADATAFILGIFKWLLVAVGVLYMFVAIIISRDISLMRATVTTTHTGILRLISYIHLLLSGLLLLYFLLFL